jgi:hypothetical protein
MTFSSFLQAGALRGFRPPSLGSYTLHRNAGSIGVRPLPDLRSKHLVPHREWDVPCPENNGNRLRGLHDVGVEVLKLLKVAAGEAHIELRTVRTPPQP